MRTLSPGERVLVMAASQPPEPEDGKRNIWPSRVLKIFFRSSNRGSVKAGRSGARWSSIVISMARRTAWGTLVGPGINSPLMPGMISSLKHSGSFRIRRSEYDWVGKILKHSEHWPFGIHKDCKCPILLG